MIARGSKGGSDDKESDLLPYLLYLPITRGYMQIHQARNGEMNLEDVYKLIEICLYEDKLKKEALKNAKHK